MSKRVQLRRGTTAETNAFTGAVGEVTVDTDKKTVVVHDGVTAGGTPLARVSEVPSLVPQATSTQQGVVRQATGTEVTNKSNVNAYITPANALSITNTSNAATATKLATARTINGVPFDGTANITIADSTKLPTTGGAVTGALTVNGYIAANGGFGGNYIATDNRTLRPNATHKGSLGAYFTSQGGLTGAADANYGDLLVMNSYHDATGGNANALFFDKGSKSIFHYQAAQDATSWGTASRLAYVTDNVASATNCGRSILAGNGLTGGGTLTANQTLTLGTPSTITASTGNTVSASSHTHSLDVNSIPMFGAGQWWQNVTSSRSVNTTYTNSTGKPIIVNIVWNYLGGGNNYATLLVNNKVAARGVQGWENDGVYVVIPPGSSYQYVSVGWGIVDWMEYR